MENIKWRVGLLNSPETSNYFAKYEDALKWYNSICIMFDYAHLIEIKDGIEKVIY